MQARLDDGLRRLQPARNSLQRAGLGAKGYDGLSRFLPISCLQRRLDGL
jgi:hypothetical protein